MFKVGRCYFLVSKQESIQRLDYRRKAANRSLAFRSQTMLSSRARRSRVEGSSHLVNLCSQIGVPWYPSPCHCEEPPIRVATWQPPVEQFDVVTAALTWKTEIFDVNLISKESDFRAGDCHVAVYKTAHRNDMESLSLQCRSNHRYFILKTVPPESVPTFRGKFGSVHSLLGRSPLRGVCCLFSGTVKFWNLQ